MPGLISQQLVRRDCTPANASPRYCPRTRSFQAWQALQRTRFSRHCERSSIRSQEKTSSRADRSAVWSSRTATSASPSRSIRRTPNAWSRCAAPPNARFTRCPACPRCLRYSRPTTQPHRRPANRHRKLSPNRPPPCFPTWARSSRWRAARAVSASRRRRLTLRSRYRSSASGSVFSMRTSTAPPCRACSV